MPEQRRRGLGWIGLCGPPAALLAVAGVTSIAYDAGPPSVAVIVFIAYSVALLLGPSVLYPLLRRRGATTGQALVASLLLPVLWQAKECAAVAAVFSFWEGVFYAVNPLALGLFVGLAVQVAVAELLLRRAWRSRWELAAWPGFVLAGVAVLSAGFTVVARRASPTEVFYAYIAVYRALFGG